MSIHKWDNRVWNAPVLRQVLRKYDLFHRCIGLPAWKFLVAVPKQQRRRLFHLWLVWKWDHVSFLRTLFMWKFLLNDNTVYFGADSPSLFFPNEDLSSENVLCTFCTLNKWSHSIVLNVAGKTPTNRRIFILLKNPQNRSGVERRNKGEVCACLCGGGVGRGRGGMKNRYQYYYFCFYNSTCHSLSIYHHIVKFLS